VPEDRTGRRRPGRRSPAGAQTLDRGFDAGTLSGLRQAVLAVAKAAGLSAERAADVVLTVHELAANAVHHGAGAGRALLRIAGGELHCQVSDSGPGRADKAPPWPLTPGHGLWIVQRTADRVKVRSRPEGSEITAVFLLPGPLGG
jgi:anti-sigma regulatory factor (Ser/Thr protein kinase)